MTKRPGLLGFLVSVLIWGVGMFFEFRESKGLQFFKGFHDLVILMIGLTTLWAFLTLTFTLISDIWKLKGEEWSWFRPSENSQKFCQGFIVPFIILMINAIIMKIRHPSLM